ncbi:MAG: sugar transferase [Clostridia bacterium]|nr:sugar transferase [Clostridia bacterium]
MKKSEKRKIYEGCVKRILDVVFACVFLFLLSPILLLTALLVRIRLGAPVIFRQARGGLYGREFMILKFRTMADKRDSEGRLLPDAERLTGLGLFLRRTSIDELPQLINILRGDMSFVGPRPQLAEFLPHYTEDEMLRHTVRPGLTGLAQVKGRNSLPWKRRFEFDVEYVKGVSFFLDLKIVFLTFATLLGRGDDNSESFYDRK